jgi:hypothetical protein
VAEIVDKGERMREEFMQIRKECRRRQKELNYTVEPRARAAVGADNLDWCRLHAAEVAAFERAELEEYRSTHARWFGVAPGEDQVARELHHQTREGRRYGIGQYGCLLAEIISGASLAAITLNAAIVLSTIVGFALALLAASIASAVVSRWVGHGAEVQPAKQMHRVTRGLLVLGGSWLLVFVTALTVVRSPDGAIGASIFWVSVALITLLSPVCTGLCHVAAELLSWSGRISRSLAAIRSLLRELELLALGSERSVAPSFPIRGSKAGAAGLVLMLLGGVTCRAADVPVYIYVDVSPSARAGDVTQLLKNLARKLSGYEGADALAISIIPFYENAYMATSFVDVKIAGNRARDCPVTTSELVSISRNYADAQRRQCDQFRAQTRRETEVGRSTEISKLSAAIDRLAELRLPGRCTAVNALIRRAVRERPNGISIIVSDMENSCVSREPPADLRTENQTFLVPVGSRQHPIEESFDSIQARFSHSMPLVQVLESFRLAVIMNAIGHPGNL